MIFLGSYFFMIIAFLLWDAYIGFGVDWEFEKIPVFIPAIMWWFMIPLLLIMNFSDFLSEKKNNRDLKKKIIIGELKEPRKIKQIILKKM